MRIRIIHPVAVRLELQPGDEVHVSKLSRQLETMVTAPRVDGQMVARIIGDDDEDVEFATVGRGGRRGQRSETAATK
jgi:hypothetical protein